MFFIYQGDWILASILFILANIGANGSFVFYDALLPHIARDDEVDRVSTAGYALGYLGGGVLLALEPGVDHEARVVRAPVRRWPDPAQATLPGAAGVPLGRGLVAGLLDPAVPPRAGAAGAPGCRRDIEAASSSRSGRRSIGWSRPAAPCGRYRQALLMLLAFLIYNDGIGTIMRMATIYATELKIDQGVTIASILIVQFVGIPFAFLFGMLAGRIGAKRSIALGLVVYAGICVVGYFMTTGTHFLILAILVGTVQGGTQALSRSLFASLIPRDKSGEFFGFFGTVEKFAGIFGPGDLRRDQLRDRLEPRGDHRRSSASSSSAALLLAMVDVDGRPAHGPRARRPGSSAQVGYRCSELMVSLANPSRSRVDRRRLLRPVRHADHPRAHRGRGRDRSARPRPLAASVGSSSDRRCRAGCR